MSDANPTAAPAAEPRAAWQPFTFGGIAAFAEAELHRLLLAQAAFAAVAAGCFMASLAIAWVPVIRGAAHALPDEASISGGALNWPGDELELLSEGSRLAVVVDPKGGELVGRVADLQIELGAARLRLRAELGIVEIPYDADWRIDLGRGSFVPWWGAREPWLVALAGGLMTAGLFLSWWLLALTYSPVAKLVAFFADRPVTWGGCSQLACAALLPGSVVMSLTLLLYALEALALPWLGVAFAAHLLIGWVYLVGAPLALLKDPARKPARQGQKVNPFAAAHGAAGDGNDATTRS